jgi:hypothetical protein
MFECFHMRTPFVAAGSDEQMHRDITNPRFAIDYGEVSTAARLLMGGLLRRNPTLRFGPDEIRCHTFFRGFDWRALRLQRMPSPFKPETKDEFDTQHFVEGVGPGPTAAARKMFSMAPDPYPKGVAASPLWDQLCLTRDEKAQLRDDEHWDAKF